MDDRQPLPPVFKLDDGVDVIGPCAGDNLCLVYDGAGRGGRPMKIREYYPAGVARRRVDRVMAPASEGDRELFDAGLQSFIAFCERLAAIEQKGVEPLLGLIEGYGTAYLVVEQPRGVPLAKWLAELDRQPTPAEIETVANGLCEALAVAHAADLLHLDLSPETIFIQAGGQPLLVDFAATAIGFAASAGRDDEPSAKLGYAPPEREAGDLVRMGVRSDIYSAAAILFRLVTGETPPGAGLRRAGDTVDGRLAKLHPGISQRLRDGIAAGLAMDPAERPESAAAFHGLLRAPAAGAPVGQKLEASATPPSTIASERSGLRSAVGRSIALAGAAGAFALAGALAYNLVVSPRDGEEPRTVIVAPGPAGSDPASGATSVASVGKEAAVVLDRAAEARLRVGDSFRECAGCPEVVVVPAGSFTMGSAPTELGHEPDEAPQHKVEFRAPFAMSRATVTRAEFELFVAASGYRTTYTCRVFEGGKWVDRSDLSFRNPGFAQDGDHPVVCVNWSDARAYSEWLSAKTGKRYRLASEAEWEYAARAGTTTPFWWGSEISTSQANFDGTLIYGRGKLGENREATVRAREFEPNPWGLYQVHGNVSQWVEDCWNPNYRGAPTDGSAWIAGDCTRRVLRGGSWGYAPKDVRGAYREGATAGNRNFTFGFRVVRVIEPEL